MTIVVLLIALGFAIGMTPLVRQLALRINFVAAPKKDRLHTVATPLMGGVALYIALTGALLLLALILAISDSSDLDNTFTLTELFAVMLCGTFLAAIGLWDDWNDLNSKVKLALQFIPVVALTAATDIQMGLPVGEVFNIGLTVCWYLYVINAFNYTDNMDGISGMIATVAGMFFTVIALMNDQVLLGALAAALAGTSFGFLRYNLFVSEQKIFMGDVGTMFLGFLLATIGLMLSFPAESPWVTWPVPVLVLGVPIFDTAMVFISRWRRGVSFLQGGTDHLSHRFGRLAFGRYGVPFAIGLMGSALGCLALIVMTSDLENSLAAQALAGGCAFYMLYWLEFRVPREFITGKPKPVADVPVADAEEVAEAQTAEQA